MVAAIRGVSIVGVQIVSSLFPRRSRRVAPHFSIVSCARSTDGSTDHWSRLQPTGFAASSARHGRVRHKAAYTVIVDAPGATRDPLQVSIEGRHLTLMSAEPFVLSTSVRSDRAVSEPKVLYRERTRAIFALTVSLPAEDNNAASQAKFDQVVRSLTLVKEVSTGSSKLSIGWAHS